MQYCTLLYGWIHAPVGKMKGILHSHWLPEQPRWTHLAHSGFPTLVPQVKSSFFGHYNESLLTKLVRARWLNVDIILFCIYIDLGKNYAKKNLANIQPSWPHALSITHIIVLETIFIHLRDSVTLNHYCKSSIKPPGGLIFFKHFWGGGLIERGGLFNLAKRITCSKNTVVWDRVDLRVVQLKSLSKVFKSLVGA